MSEMAERLTRKLFEILPTKIRSFDDLTPEGRAKWLQRGRELLAALREPTEVMVAAGMKELAGDKDCTAFDQHYAGLFDTWRAMIDAACPKETSGG